MSARFVKGKARTELPRSKDLRLIRTAGDRSPNHAANGQFTPRNTAATDRAAKQAIGKTLGLRPSDAAVAIVARDAARVFGVMLREMPSDAAVVRNLLALLARHSAIGAYANVRADELGLDTAEGAKWLEVAMRHGARVERLTVTCLDVATKLASVERRGGNPHALLAAALGGDDAPATPRQAERAAPRPTLTASESTDAAEGRTAPTVDHHEPKE